MTLRLTKRAAAQSDFRAWWPYLVPLAASALLYAAAAAIVGHYYETRLPHYDSVAHYAFLFELQNTTTRDGVLAGLTKGARYSASWLHPAYALPLSWLPIRAPWILVSLNFVLLAMAQASVLAYLRTTEAGRWRQLVGITLPLLPASFYVWDGGLPDLRRDCQYVLLLLAVFFMGMAWARSPSRRKALALGVLAGLTIWSRDNAASGLVLIGLPIAALAAYRQGLASSLKLALVPAAVALAIATPYVALTARLTWFRYNFIVWGIGEDRVESLLKFWTAPLDVLRGGVYHLNGMPNNGTSTTMLFGALAAVLIAGLATRLVRLDPSRLRQPWVAELLLAGVWVMVAFVAYNCLVLGYGARWHGMPFMPTLIGDVAVILALTNGVAAGRLAERRPFPRAVVPILVAGLIVGAAPWRMVASAYPARGPEAVANLRDAARTVAGIAQDRGMFQLWIKGFSDLHVNFYVTMEGMMPVRGVDTRIADEPGVPFIPIQPLRPDHDHAALRQKLLLVAREASPYVLVAEDPAAYQASEDAYGQFWLMAIGRPAIEELLADPWFVKAARFTIDGTPLVLLENRRLVARAP